ncbi:uncharacterized protein si:ch211-214p13.7 isoform X3 [Takifugu flavidus]|uniref:Uncharacterized protein n=1 Tax=Takifugu flavidus TaxID=433684 RepID=A0A5C6PQ05_9TELE|nr:uncharacterized protein si:ch211-214p13.7 isoform X3 [Takifugu flavidus]TWW80966.1 hypothetical protein D4764_01G0007810 [Takifugu flavidus]
MGICTSQTKKKDGASARTNNQSVDQQKEEDVTYASVDHSTDKGSRRPRAPSDSDCEYSTVQVPAALPHASAASAANDGEDDYELMG